tara:strand:- start:308 stop:889 length:582 start_codon:yes stop_codon:yes gene_type:complete
MQENADRLAPADGASADDTIYGEILNDGSDGGDIVIDNPVPLTVKMSSQEKQKRAMALKLAGASYAQIAESIGYADASGAYKAVSRGMKNSLQESAGDLRKIHYGRLEHMLMLVWPAVNQGDSSAVSSALQVMDRMERLYGLNEAQKVDITAGARETIIVADGEKSEYIKALREAIEEDSQDIVDAEVVEDED